MDKMDREENTTFFMQATSAMPGSGRHGIATLHISEEPIIRGYFSNWATYNKGEPTAFPGYDFPASNDSFELARKANTALMEDKLPYVNSIAYSFLEIKQDENRNIGTYTDKSEHLGNLMFFDPWGDFQKPKGYVWNQSSPDKYPLVKWMNDHKGYFPEKNDAGNTTFDPAASDFPTNWMQYGSFENFSAYHNEDGSKPEKIIAIGGYGDKYLSGWKAALQHPDHFINSTFDIATQFHMDGIDLDWEPLSQIYEGDHTEGLISLTKAIKEAAASRGLNDFKISFPITVSEEQIENFQNSSPNAWTELMKYVDHVSIMGYDMHGNFDLGSGVNTGVHSPLYPAEGDITEFSINSAVDKLHEFGIPYQKMILGLPTYARGVAGVEDRGVNQPFSAKYHGVLDSGDPDVPGVSSYRWIMDNYGTEVKVTSARAPNGDNVDNGAYVNFCDDGSKIFASFDNEDSALAKVQYAQDHDMAGVMVWRIEDDAADKHSLLKILHDSYNVV